MMSGIGHGVVCLKVYIVYNYNSNIGKDDENERRNCD